MTNNKKYKMDTLSVFHVENKRILRHFWPDKHEEFKVPAFFLTCKTYSDTLPDFRLEEWGGSNRCQLVGGTVSDYFCWTCEKGYLNMIKYLKELFGLTIDDARAKDNYALRYACFNGHLEVVKYLKEVFGLTADDAYFMYGINTSNLSRRMYKEILKYLKKALGVTTM